MLGEVILVDDLAAVETAHTWDRDEVDGSIAGGFDESVGVGGSFHFL